MTRIGRRALKIGLIIVISATAAGGVQGQTVGPDGVRPPFTATLSNDTPLAFGMDVSETSRALGQQLHYVRGQHGDAIYLALRDLGGSGLVPHHHRLFLQFRRGRLAGWKEDYGESWMWR